MANWCGNTFVVFGPRSELAALRDYMVKHGGSDHKQAGDDAVKCNSEMCAKDGSTFDEEKVRAEYGSSGDAWIVHAFIDLYSYEDLDGFSKDGMNIRGYITGIDDSDIGGSDPHIIIHSESAWGPWDAFFRQVLEDHFPDLDFVYEAIEGGNGVYVNSDTDHRFLTDEYRVWDGDMEDYYSSFDDLKSFVKSRSGFALDDVNTYEDLTKFITDYNEMLCKYDNEDNQIYVDEFSSD